MFTEKKKDSRTENVSPNSAVYITSEPAEDRWGQPSASKYVFWIEGTKVRGTLLSGVYISQYSSEGTHPNASSTLAKDTEAWDMLSDEALLDFEASLE